MHGPLSVILKGTVTWKT